MMENRIQALLIKDYTRFLSICPSVFLRANARKFDVRKLSKIGYGVYMRFFLLALIGLVFQGSAQAAITYELECIVDRKLDRQTEYDRASIDDMQWSVIIRHHDNKYATVSRCDTRAPCDEYRVEHYEFTEGVNISKYYYFRGQFDVQVFGDGRFIENNGRGTIAFGQCKEQ